MKAIRSAVETVLLFALIALLCCSCSFIDFTSTDSLIRPPKLTGENALIQQAFEKAVGKDVMLVSPVSGDFRSAFVQYDIDRNGTDETLVFYCRPESPDEAHLHLLRFNGERWYSAGDMTGNGSEVYSVSFLDLDKAVGYEIAVTWTVSDSKRNKTLSLYKITSLPEERIDQLSVLQIYDYMVCDFDFDGQQELLYLMDNGADQEQPFKANMIKMDPADGGFVFVCELQLQLSVNVPVKMSFDIRDGHYRLYIDCMNYDGSYMTEVLWFDTAELVLKRAQDAEGNVISEMTGRNAAVFSEDLNNDRIIEFPVQRPYENSAVYTKDPDGEAPMQLITFARLQRDSLNYLSRNYFYAPEGEFRFKADAFLNGYFAAYDAANKELRFYQTDVPETPVFTVKYVSLTPAEQEIFIEIAEPTVFRYTKEQLKSFVEIL